MPKRFNLSDLRRAAKMRGGSVVARAYRGVHRKYEWICGDCGRVWSAQFNSIRRGSWCPNCSRDHGTKAKLVSALRQFVKTHKRPPTRREFDSIPNAPRSSSAKKYFGSYNNFLESEGQKTRRSFGGSWKVWEGLVHEMLIDRFGDKFVQRTVAVSKASKNSTIDFYIPNRRVGIDAKTSDYEVDLTARQVQRFQRSGLFRKIEFWCMVDTKNSRRHQGVVYRFPEELIPKIKSKSLKARVKDYIQKGAYYRSEVGLISKEHLIRAIQTRGRELGRAPKMREVTKDGRFFSFSPFYAVFGNWNNALIASGFTRSRAQYADISKKEAIKKFVRASKSFRRIHMRYPNAKEYEKFIAFKRDSVGIRALRHVLGKTFKEIQREHGVEAIDGFVLFRDRRNRAAIERFKTEFSKHGLRIAGVMPGPGRMRFRLECVACQHKFIRTIDHWRRQSRCPSCRTVEQRNQLRTPISKVRKDALSKGFTFLGTYFANQQTYYPYLCNSCGQSYHRKHNTILNGKRFCVQCRNKSNRKMR